eukprot:TRINITY_DN32071_c0_g1_i1.p1 TRINITY_DN32071_c0_g1~~TRINITY_DN32071_c0_g1_i1.p1  ORF type:complete len:1620 (+),score=651.41 TRINITY_DN32071_c0_g1_i1:66-4862(+)
MAATLDMKLLLGYSGSPLAMVGEQELVYSVANSGVVLDLETGVRRYIGGEGKPIGPVAVHPKRIMMVVGEEGEHAGLRIYGLPAFNKVQMVQDVGMGKVGDIQFARDGQHLVVLASIPTFVLTVFAVKASTKSVTKICDVDTAKYQPRSATFSPFSKDDVMAIGNGHVVFWKQEKTQGVPTLVPTEGKPQAQVKVVCGAYTTQNGIALCGTSTGDIYEFDTTVGAGVPWWESPGGSSSPVAGLLLTRHHVMAATADGILRFFRADSHVIERSITLSSSHVSTILASPKFNTFFVGGKDGVIQSVKLPGYEKTNLKADEFRDIVDEGSVWNDYSGGAYRGIIQLRRPDKAGKEPNLAVTVAADNTLRVWDYAGNALVAKVPCGVKPTAIAQGSGSVVLVGSETAHLRCFDVANVNEPRLAGQHKLSDKSGAKITHIAVCPYRQRLAINIAGVGIYFSSQANTFAMLGFLPVEAIGGSPDVSIVEVIWADAETVMFANDTGDVRCAQFPQAESEEASKELPKSLVTYFWRLELPAERIVVTEDTPEAYTIVAHSRDRYIKTYSLDKSVRQADATKIPIKKPITQLKQSDALGTDLVVQNGMIYASYKDGRVDVRDLSSRPADPPKVSVLNHRCLFGGCVGLIVNGRKLVSVGGDGLLVVYALEAKENEIQDAAPFTISQSAQLSDGAEVGEEETTYLVRVAEERHNLLQMKHEPYRKALMDKIAGLRDRLQEYKRINANAAPDEKLETQAFMIESQRREILDQGERLRQEKVEEIKWCNLARDYLADGIKKQCWNSMSTHLKVLKGIAPNANLNPQITVPNYSIRSVSDKDNSLLRKVRFMREVEQLEWKRRKGFEALDNLQAQEGEEEEAAKKKSEEDEEDEAEVDEEDAPKPMSAAEEAQLSTTPLLYNKFMTYTRSRAMLQIVLLQQEIYVKQREFNAHCEAALKRKGQDVALIAEKNVRIQQIHKELESDDGVLVPKKVVSEHPDKVLEVTDAEIEERVGARKVEGKEDGMKVADDEEEEGYVRALKIMMDNRLERDERVVVEIKIPPFADESNKEMYRPVEDWTDEEQRAFKDYQKKLQKRQEEEEKHRRGLQAELKELNQEVQGIINSYEQSLQQLFNVKLDTDTEVCQMDLEIIKLCQAQVQQEEMESHYKKLIHIVDNVRKETQKASNAAAESLHILQGKREECEELARNERNKLGDKEIRNQPPFSETEEYCDILIKVLRKSLKPKKEKVKKEREDRNKKKEADNPDPFAFIEEEEEDKKAAGKKQVPQETDVKLDKPDGLRDDIWRDFLDFRRERQEAEKEQKVLVDDLHELQRTNDRLTRESKAHASNLEEKERLLQEFKQQMVREGYNLDVLHTFKQGKIEVEQEAVVTDYADAILINKDHIHELNVQIREHGKAKVDKMMEIMQFKKGIRYIEWENQVLSHEVKFCEMEHKHLHTLRVTKAVQEFIKGGAENHHDIERERIMKKIDHVRTTMQNKIDEKKLQMQKIKRVIKEKQHENAELEAQVKNAKQLVSQREEIYNLQSTGLDSERNAKLMKNMRVTRKLEDVAKAQQEEMKLLKKEIDRLRERTFPSFAVVSKRVVGNPDETR